jgi:acetoin utilization deacetylase AcuC-like enzyme
LDRYRPQFVLLSAGFDALMWDRVAHLSLEPSSYRWITESLVQAAHRHAEGRVVSVLEGGYDLANLGLAVVEHVRGLMA